jgi:hypothetical protein
MRIRNAAAASIMATLALAMGAAEAGAASSTLRTGFMDDGVLGLADADRSAWLNRASSVGASVMRVNLHWDLVAPRAPTVANAADPLAPDYNFALVDAQIRAAQAAGMTVLLNVSRSPSWAQGPGRPKSFVSYGANWKPDVAAFGQFMSAVAKRYAGTTPDPTASGQTLPKVDSFQIWNEPNLNLYLGPQYEDGKPYAPIRFRELLNAGYASVKAAQPGATVAAAGMAPFGDPVSQNATRTRPIAFLRSTFCLDQALDRTCADVANADVVSLHPYAVDRPGRHAYDPDDATVPDYNRVATVVNAARTAKTLGPKTPQYWVTEVSYDSDDPDPKGVPLATRARYISEAMWRVWRVGVNTVVWYLMRDAAPTPSYASTYQSGVFYRSGRRKSDARAFRFPLMVTGKGASRLNVWFRTPTAGTTSVQIRRSGRWTTAVRKRGLPLNGVASVKVPRDGVTGVRGVAGKATSYVWNVG